MKLQIQMQIFITMEWGSQSQRIEELLMILLHLQLGNLTRFVQNQHRLVQHVLYYVSVFECILTGIREMMAKR